jgi:hypothetical protein
MRRGMEYRGSEWVKLLNEFTNFFLTNPVILCQI